MVMSDSPPAHQSSSSSSTEEFAPSTALTANSENPLLSFQGTELKRTERNKDSELLVLQRSLEAEQHQTALLRRSLDSEKKRCQDLVDQLAMLKQQVLNIREKNAVVLQDQDAYISRMEEAIKAENTYLKGALSASDDEVSLQAAEIKRQKLEIQAMKDELSQARVIAASAQVEQTARQIQTLPRELLTHTARTEEPPQNAEPWATKIKINLKAQTQDSPGTQKIRRIATEDAVRRAIPFTLAPVSEFQTSSAVSVPLDLYDKTRANSRHPQLVEATKAIVMTPRQEEHDAKQPEKRTEIKAPGETQPLLLSKEIPHHALATFDKADPDPPVPSVITSLPPGVSPALRRPVPRRQGHPLHPAPQGNLNHATDGPEHRDTASAFRIPSLDFSKVGPVPSGPVVTGSQTERGIASAQARRWPTNAANPANTAPHTAHPAANTLEADSPLNSARSLPSLPPASTDPRLGAGPSRFRVLREWGGYPRTLGESEVFV